MVYVILEKDEPYDGEIQATPVYKGDYDYYKAKGYTTETFEAWKDRLASQGVIKAVFNYRKR